MPYIITTRRNLAHERITTANGTVYNVSRRAVATAEDVRDYVHNLDADYRTMAHLDCILDGTSRLPVGPLSDGTVIEIERIGWDSLDDTGILARHGIKFPDDELMCAEIIDAYNAREV